MQHDHWLNPEHFSTANLDYRTNNSSWKQAFRRGLIQNRLWGEPSQAHPLPRSLQVCSTWYFQTKRNRRSCSVWEGYGKTLLMLLFPCALSSYRTGEGGQGLCSRSPYRFWALQILQHQYAFSTRAAPQLLWALVQLMLHSAHWHCWNSWFSDTPNIFQKRQRSGRYCRNPQHR